MNKEILNKMGISTYELVEDFIFVDNKVKAVDKSDESEGNDKFLKSLDYYLNNFTKDNESALDFLNSNQFLHFCFHIIALSFVEGVPLHFFPWNILYNIFPL